MTDGALWLTDTGRVHRFQPDTLEYLGGHEVGSTTAFPPDAQGVALGSAGVWVPLAGKRAVALLDVSTAAIKRQTKVAGMPYAVLEVGATSGSLITKTPRSFVSGSTTVR